MMLQVFVSKHLSLLTFQCFISTFPSYHEAQARNLVRINPPFQGINLPSLNQGQTTNLSMARCHILIDWPQRGEMKSSLVDRDVAQN